MAPRRRKAIAKQLRATTDFSRLPESLLLDCVLPFAGYRASLYLNTVLKGRLSAQETAWGRSERQGLA